MTCLCATRAFETSVRLRRGAVPRTVRILLATRLDQPDRLAPERVLTAFLTAVEAGLFGRTTVSDRSHRIEVMRGYGVMADVFEVTFSHVAPRAFAALSGMVAVSVPGAVRLEIHELNRDERTLVVRGFEREDEATILEVDWEIAFASAETSCLVVRFRERPSAETADKTVRVLRAWADIVDLGAWPPPDGEPARAVSPLVGPGGAKEIVAALEALACAYGAFEALFEALDGIHERQPIERVSIPYRVGDPRHTSRPSSDVAARLADLDSRGGDAHG